jgi:predicted nuclease of predicted toxin-antitoxin system
VKFLVDMPLSASLAKWLADQGHDAVHATAIGLDRAPDAEIIARAAQDERTIITADLDYPRLLALAGAVGPGLILFRAGDWGEAEIIARIRGVIDGIDAADLARSIVVVDRDRIRKRRLPIG